MGYGRQVGYIRVSSVDQNTGRQLDGLKLDRTFTEKASGKDTKRPELEKCLEWLFEGDTLHVHSIDRLARNLSDLLKIVTDLTDKGVSVVFHKENLTFTGEKIPMQTLQLQMMGAFAEFERALIRERQREGIAIAKKAGKYKGRPAKLTKEQVEEIRRAVAGGSSKKAVAEHFGISRTTLYALLGKV